MIVTEEAAKRLLELRPDSKDGFDFGIRITAKEGDNGVSYQVFWEEKEFENDQIIYQAGLKIFIDFKSNRLIDDTTVFLTEQDGQEGLFIMNHTSNCSTCSEACF